MKKSILLLVSIIFSLSTFAQVENPNRMLLHKSSGMYEGYVLEKVDSITFKKVDGEVSAEVYVNEVTLEKAVVSVMRSDACQGFKISCLPSIKANAYSDDALIQYIDNDTDNIYYQDFENAELTGVAFEPNTDYTIATVGIDEYGVSCDVYRAYFTTPSLPLVGNPYVDTEVVDTQLTSFTVKFIPNSDVSSYSVLAGEKGTMQSQFEMFAPMFGFVNMGQMIQGWGIPYTAEETYTWSGMAPNTEYEVFIQALDSEGTMAPYQVIELSTAALGGEGVAEVKIELGEYKLADWYGEMLPSQFISFTPNDQTSCYRISVYTADIYDADVDAIKSELCSEPPMPTVGWYQYEALTTDYQIDPNTSCVAIAAAKNINGEWGPVTELRFTTPSESPTAIPSKKIQKRNLGNNVNSLGKLPVFKSGKGVMLIQK